MYIAVNNDHGWGKASTVSEAMKIADRNGRRATLCKVWLCKDNAYVEGIHGDVYGVLGESTEYTKTRIARAWKVKA